MISQTFTPYALPLQFEKIEEDGNYYPYYVEHIHIQASLTSVSPNDSYKGSRHEILHKLK